MLETVDILIPGSDAYALVHEYAIFTESLMSFASLCSEKPRRAKRDYVKAFKWVKHSYDSLLLARKIPDWVTYWVDPLIDDIANSFQNQKIEDIDLAEISSLINGFLQREVLSPQANNFRDAYLHSAIASHARDFYTEELFNVISTPLENNNYDAAVLAAFKYLDSTLQKLAGLDPYQCYGEELINKVFSPNSGVLQINTHPNEQIGLRNWFSGANAVLRNPIAHRFVNLDEKSTLNAISMVALMVKIATELSEKTDKKDST